MSERISWICETFSDADGMLDTRVIRPGMSRAEIEATFPPHANSLRAGKSYNMTELIKAIHLEKAGEERTGVVGNIRSLWYERLLHVLINVMGESKSAGNLASMSSMVNGVRTGLIKDGVITYDDLELLSAKSKNFHVGVAEESPYPGAILFAEKDDFYPILCSVADNYGITFITGGGFNSLGAAKELIKELRRGYVDLSQEFTVYSFGDCGPHGYIHIPETFCEHLRTEIPNVRLVRLGLFPKEMKETTLRLRSEPYSIDAPTETGRKIQKTMWERFVEETGGLFLDGQPVTIESNIFKNTLLEEVLGRLCEHLDGFEYQIQGAKEFIASNWFLARDRVVDDYLDNMDREPNEELTKIDNRRDEIAEEIARLTTDERREINELFGQMRAIESQIKDWRIKAAQKAAHLHNESHELGRRQKEIERHLRDYWTEERMEVVGVADDTSFDVRDWGKWFDELDISKWDGKELVGFGIKDRRVRWEPKCGAESNRIVAWIEDRIQAEIDDYL